MAPPWLWTKSEVLLLHELPFGLWFEVINPTLILGEKTFNKAIWIRFKHCQVRLCHDKSGELLVRCQSRSTHWTKTFDMSSSLWRMFSTRSREMLITLAIWLTVRRLSFIAIWWMRSMFSWVVVVERPPDFGSSWRFFLPLLNSAAHFFTVDKAGASSPKVATLSAWISLGANPFFCKYRIRPRCQIASIFTRSAKRHNAKFFWCCKISLLIFKVQCFLFNVSLPEEKHRSQYQESLILTHARFHCSIVTPS